MSIIPRAPMARIMFKVGAKRVSDSASSALADAVEQIAEEIASKSIQIAKHSGRKTVQEGDIRLAAR